MRTASSMFGGGGDTRCITTLSTTPFLEHSSPARWSTQAENPSQMKKKRTNILPNLFIIDILWEDHVRQHHHSTRLTEPLPIFLRLAILIVIDNFPHLPRPHPDALATATGSPGALVRLGLALVVVLDLEGVDDSGSVSPKTLTLFVTPFGHHARSKIGWVAPTTEKCGQTYQIE